MKNETDALNETIIVLQEKRVQELKILKEQLCLTFESLEPINLLKSTIKKISSSSEIKSDILNNALGLGTGFLIKKLWVGRTRNPFKNIFGTLIQFAIANVVSKNADGIKSVGENLLQRYLKHRKEL